MAVDVGSAVGYLDLDISGFLAGLKSAQSEADKQSKNIATTIGNNISGAGKKLTSVGTTLTKNVTVPLLGIGAAGLKVATDFEKGMSEVKAISGATGKDFDALREKAIELGADTAFSAGEVAAAMTEMAKAGWSSQQIIDGMSGVLSAAAASGEGLATVSTIVADAITGFGMEAKDSTRIADLLTQAANSGTIGIVDLGESFKYIAPVAGAMGLSVEDVTTALSAMSMAGIKGSQAGTSLRTMLTRLVKPNDAVADAMKALGIEVSNADGSMKSLDDIVSNLRDSFDGLTESEKAKYAATLAGQEGMAGMLALLNLTEEEYNNIAKSMDNAGGIAGQTAAIMQDNLQSKVEQLGGSLESLAIKLSDLVIPYLQKFVVWLTNLIDKFTSLDPEIQKTILIFAGVLAVIGPVVAIIGKLTSGVGSLFTAFGKLSGGFKAVAAGGNAGAGILAKLGGALTGITVPIAAVIAVVAVLAAAFVTLWKNNEEFRNNIIAIWEQVKATFDRLVQGIVDRLNSLGIDFGKIGETLKSIWQGFCDFLAPIFELVFQGIADKFSFFVDIILGALDFFIALFTGNWQGTWDAIKGIFETTWNHVENIFTSITSTIISIGQTVLGWFNVEWNTSVSEVGSFFQNTWQGIVDFFIMVWTNVRDFFIGLWQTIWNSVGPLFNEIVGTFQNAWEIIKLVWERVEPFFAAIWEGIKLAVGALWVYISTGFKNVWEGIKLIWEMVVPFFKVIWEGIKGAFSTVKEVLLGFFKTAWEAIKAVWNIAISYFTMVWAGIKAVFAFVKGVLSGNFTDAWEAIKNAWDKAKAFFSSIWTGIKNVFSSTGTWFKNTFKAAWDAIKNVFSSWGSFFGNLWNQIKDKFSKIGTNISSAISSSVKSGLNGVISSIEGIINSGVNMINGAINLINNIPGVNIGNISKLSLPRLAKGGVVNHRMIAEIGEDGREAVVPLEKNLGWMKNLVAEFMSKLKDLFDNHSSFSDLMHTLIEIKEICRSIMTSEGVGYVSHAGFSKRSKHFTGDNDDNNNNTFGQGDTYNFYSPKPIDEIEAAKQMKKTKRELAEGF